MVKKVKLETKRLGYFLVINAMILINLVFYFFYAKGLLNQCVDLVKWVMGTGIVLLLGRHLIAEIITSYLNSLKK